VNKLERFFAVFDGKKIDRLPYAADIFWWYDEHSKSGTLPEEYKNMKLADVARATGILAQLDAGFCRKKRGNVERTEKSEVTYDNEGRMVKKILRFVDRTPVGKLESTYVNLYNPHMKGPSSSLAREFPVKNVEDMRVMKYIFDHTTVEPAFERYVSAQKSLGGDGIALALIPHSPVNRILLDIMGQLRGLVALYRHRQEVEDLMRSIERVQDEIYKLAEKSPARIFEFGEHVHSDFNDPNIFRKYQIPYFRKRIEQLHGKNKICYCHWDGYFRSLLPLIKDTGFDAIEAITPKPAGDVTMAELREAVEGTDIILWGGIPASIFQEPYSEQYFEKYVIDMLKTMAPGDRFIVALGDNLGPTGSIHRLKMVNDILEEHGYYPVQID
jgi:hypothetical protein